MRWQSNDGCGGHGRKVRGRGIRAPVGVLDLCLQYCFSSCHEPGEQPSAVFKRRVRYTCDTKRTRTKPTREGGESDKRKTKSGGQKGVTQSSVYHKLIFVPHVHHVLPRPASVGPGCEGLRQQHSHHHCPCHCSSSLLSLAPLFFFSFFLGTGADFRLVLLQIVKLSFLGHLLMMANANSDSGEGAKRALLEERVMVAAASGGLFLKVVECIK